MVFMVLKLLLLATVATAALDWDSFEQLFPETLRSDFEACQSMGKNSGERGICNLLAATNTQIDLLLARRSSTVPENSPSQSNFSCKYKDENGASLHRYATDRSQELTTLLDRYTRMHKLCVEAEYNRLHDSKYHTTCRYVVWSCSFGLGNRLMSLVSAFLYAILSQRVLLVENEGWEKLFCEPFPGSTWRLPRGMTMRHDSTFASFSAFYACSRNSTRCGRDSRPRIVPVVYLSTSDASEHEFLVCPSATKSVRNAPWINVRNSNQYFAPGFFLNPALQPALAALFPSRRVFHDLARFLLNPSDPVWARIDRIHRRLISNATRAFGVQIRDFQGKYTRFYDTTVPLCIQRKLGICPLEEGQAKNGTFAVYVATMVAGHVKRIREALGRSGLRFEFGHQQADGAQFDDADHQQKALADMWLLSHADVLLTSGMSTFGYTAQGLAGVAPYRMTHWPRDPCLVAVSSDPCFHFGPPRGMACDEDGFKLGDDDTRGANILWACKDFAGSGIQLVEA